MTMIDNEMEVDELDEASKLKKKFKKKRFNLGVSIFWKKANIKPKTNWQKLISDINYIISFPAYETAWFNEDGTSQFKSKLMICVFAPTVLLVGVMIFLLFIPLFTVDYVNSKVVVSRNSIGIPLFNNNTNTDIRPISSNFSWLLKKFKGSIGLEKKYFYREEFFKDFKVQLFDI